VWACLESKYVTIPIFASRSRLFKIILKLFGEGIRPRFSSKHIRLSRRKITLKELSAIFGFDNFAVEIAAPAFER
jgi:hypothetical protein